MFRAEFRPLPLRPTRGREKTLHKGFASVANDREINCLFTFAESYLRIASHA
ncbi:hypothetical protein BRCON_2457 [Candidatus Sumerlaea chitinivorans]|uniref:Uncharacterized protein n=1 Tax=Sumerlaea chitinivorans TaxID=2250252 RepID=A0A2Z4Y7J8_SUMC1|nr:hypothetical protein BRCON_2457 [Candidatus Sumerlaea chitinivorans]